MTTLEVTPRTRLKRAPQRGSHDRREIHAILDEGLICQLAVAVDGVPHVIPTAYGRIDDVLYVHGAAANRVLRSLLGGDDCCVSVTLVDGLVLARSAFHHSMNYRSVIAYGAMREVTDAHEKAAALRAIVEQLVPSRWPDVREPNAVESRRTLVLALHLSEASAKVRSGPPVDDEEDYQHSCWAGVIPLALRPGAVVDDPRLLPGVERPGYATDYRRPAEGSS